MFRLFRISIFAVTAVGLANAGSVTVDLATAQGSTSVCASGCGTPTVTTITGTGASTFVNALYSATLSTAVPVLPSPTPPTEFTNNPGVSSVPFVIDANSAGDPQYFNPNVTNQTNTLVIDMGGYTGGAANTGIFSVSGLYSMLEAFAETTTVQGIDVTLTGVNSSGGAVSDTFLLTAGTDYRTTNSGATTQPLCTDANPGCIASNAANVPALPGSESQTIASGTTGTVLTYNDAYLANISGINYWLDVQELELPSSGTNSFVGGYLDTVSIANISGSGATKQRMALEGLTVQTTTPEPASFFLLPTGLAAIVISRLRRRKQ
jgi:hypothetical protein